MTKENWVEIITAVQASAHPEEFGFQPDRMGGEKHSRWVWVCARNDPEMSRFAELGVAQVSVPEEYSDYLVEISAGGDNGSRFQRLVVAALKYPNMQSLMDGIPSGITPQLINAMERAGGLRVEDLVDSRAVFPRFPNSLH